MKKTSLMLFPVFLCAAISLMAQDTPVNPAMVTTGTYYGLSKPLRDLPKLTPEEFLAIEQIALVRRFNEGLKYRNYPFAATALPKGDDPAWQKTMGTTRSGRSPILNFDGQTSPYFPPDDNGVVGPNHYMQTVNCVYAIYDKSGSLVAGPTAINLLFGSVTGANRNDGDPIVLYDEEADRWLVTEFSIPLSGPNYLLMAVSQTNDPTGSWHQYSFQVDNMPDYPKYGIWQNGYYVGVNNNSGNDIYVMERAPMLVGGTAQMVAFNNPWRPASSDGFMCVPPVDNDGTFAPPGSPGIYIAFNDDALGGGSDQLWIYELDVDWTSPSTATFIRTQQIDVLPFNANFGPTWNNIVQPGTGQKLDAIPQVVMNVPQYRNFGSYQTLVCCHTVNVNGAGLAGIRWYELRKTSGDWTLRQQATYAPDAHSRWMGSIMLNGNDKIALGYSVSSSTVYPGIRYCGQSPGEYALGTGILDIGEDTIYVGANSQSSYNRWGDYSLMSIDPTDDETFWYTNQYVGSGNSRRTRIASFQFITGPEVVTLPATNITWTSATLNGTVNPLGNATDYYFRYGTNFMALTDSTEPVSAGSGSNPVDVGTDILDLQPEEHYYFRIIATNSTGTSTGNTLSFNTGSLPVLAVSPPNQTIPYPEGNTEFYVASNTTWNVTCDALWCSVTPSGENNDTIFVVAEENPGLETRTASITVSATGTASQTVTVTQTGVPVTLAVNPPHRDMPDPPGVTEFYVMSNTGWTVFSDATWCSVTPSGSGNDTVFAWVADNPAITSRTACITVSANGAPSKSVTVTQSGKAPVLVVVPPNRDVPAQAGNTFFTVTSNTEWTVESDASWCLVTPSGSGDGVITAEYSMNLLDQPRVANITVSAPVVSSQQVTVSQAKSGIGLDEQDDNAFRIIPNPNRGSFRIVRGGLGSETADVAIVNLQGIVIHREEWAGGKEIQIDLPEPSPGLYQVVVNTEKKIRVEKLAILK